MSESAEKIIRTIEEKAILLVQAEDPKSRKTNHTAEELRPYREMLVKKSEFENEGIKKEVMARLGLVEPEHNAVAPVVVREEEKKAVRKPGRPRKK